MKLDILLVDLVVVAMVVVPYLLFIIMGWGESRQLKKRFLQETAKHLGKTDVVNSWNEIMTGIDRNLQKLVLVQRVKEDFRVEVIDLKEVIACEIRPTYVNMVINKVPSTVLKRIDLNFSQFSGEKFDVNLFDHDTTYRQDFELKNAEKLNASVKSCLSIPTRINSAA